MIQINPPELESLVSIDCMVGVCAGFDFLSLRMQSQILGS